MLLLFLAFLIYADCFGQRYKTVDIIKKSDSLIISVVGEEVFNNHFQIDTSTQINPVQNTYDKESDIKHISLSSKTQKHFKFIAIGYIFYIKKCEEPFVKTRIILDQNLNTKYPVDTSFIPGFILQGKESNFLQVDKVLNIAEPRFKKQGKKIENRIYYDPSKKNYVWKITNVLVEMVGGKSVEVLNLDPISGDTITYYEGLQAELH